VAKPSSSVYGQAWSCVSSLSSPAVFVSGNVAVAQSLARRLSTPAGGLIDDPTYGYDLSGELNDDVSNSDIAQIQSRTAAECLKDERVADAVVSITFVSSNFIVNIQVTLVTGQTFTLVLSVSQVAKDPINILSVSA
jgi:phage baseplate assembly protein W